MLSLVLICLAAGPSTGDKLQTLASARVVVAHQSVGQNVLDGVSVLATQRFFKLRIEHGSSPFSDGITHAIVGKDGSPLSKLDGFEALLDAPADVAMLELSYADIGADTDVLKLFAVFQKRLAALQARFPETRFVVATVGLTTVGRGVQALLKNKIASGAFGERQNVKRHLFNELLRKHYPKLFDLAAVQSRGCRFERDGKEWPCLRDELATDDGSHLNDLGRKEAAIAFVDAIAAAVAERPVARPRAADGAMLPR